MDFGFYFETKETKIDFCWNEIEKMDAEADHL